MQSGGEHACRRRQRGHVLIHSWSQQERSSEMKRGRCDITSHHITSSHLPKEFPLVRPCGELLVGVPGPDLEPI